MKEDILKAIHGNSYVDIAFCDFCLPSKTQLELFNMISISATEAMQ